MALWGEGTVTGFMRGAPIREQIVFINTATGVYDVNYVAQPELPPPNTWISYDVTSIGVPADALAVQVVSKLIITSGHDSIVPDLGFAFKDSSYPDPDLLPLDLYFEQGISIGPSGGVRTDAGPIPVSLVGGCFQWGWLRGDGQATPPQWPDQPIPPYGGSPGQGASYGVNMYIVGYLRP